MPIVVRSGAALAAVLLAGLLAGCATPPPPPDAVVEGIAVIREPVRFVPEAVLEATLLDVSDVDLPPLVLGRQRVEPLGPSPFVLRIPYRSAQFVRGGRYEVRVVVRLEQRLLWTSARRYPVPEDADYRRVSVRLLQPLPTAATVQAGVPLALTHWRLLEVDGQVVPAPPAGGQAPHLVLQTEQPRATGFGGCNRFYADFEVQGERLRIAAVTSGIALCLDTAALEAQFFRALEGTAYFRQEGELLELLGPRGESLARLQAQERLPEGGAAR